MEYFNNIKVERKAAKKDLVFRHLNRRNMDEFESRLYGLYSKLDELEEKYLDEKPDPDSA